MCSVRVFYVVFFFKQKTAYEIYQCDWSSDVCSSDLVDLSTPLSLAPDAPLWLEITQIGDIDTTFRWEFSTVPSPMGLALINPTTVDWKETAINAHNAFQLSTIPEPNTCVLFLTTALLIGHCRTMKTRLCRRPKT